MEMERNQLDQLFKHPTFRKGVKEMVVNRVHAVDQYSTDPVVPIADIHGSDTLNYKKGEKLLRCKLATCYRLADLNCWCSDVSAFISARLDVDHFLVKPYGLMCNEVTAASLVKVNSRGDVVDPGCTTLLECDDFILLHLAIYAAQPNVNCIFNLVCPSAVSVSTMKCGLMPVCQEAMAVGKISYLDYNGPAITKKEIDQLGLAFEPNSKVLFLRNRGVVVSGDTIEETYRSTDNVMTAITTQLNLIPFGLSSISLPSEVVQQNIYKLERELPFGVDTRRRWLYGEVEFEALMRQLDRAGYSTGYVYLDAAAYQPANKSIDASDVLPSLSGSEDKENLALNRSLVQNLLQKKAPDLASTISPNVYHKKELNETTESSSIRKITRWVSEDSDSQWKSESAVSGLSKPKAFYVSPANLSQFAPQGSNPRELKEKVQEIRKEYYEDAITAGPQSTVLEGVTWEEVRRIKEGQVGGGFDNVLVSAASRGIIQRDHQQKALFYKNYTLANPFENVTESELENYRKEVEKKSRKGEEALNNNQSEAALNSYNYELSFEQVKSPVHKIEPLIIDSLNSSVSGRSVLSTKPQEKVTPGPGQELVDRQNKDVPVGEHEILHRTQSANYPKKNPELIKELKQKSASLKRKDAANIPSNEGQSSKENSPSRDSTLSKEKKKKRGFHFPSFSKKKKDTTTVV